MQSWLIFALLSAVFAALVAILGKIGISKIDTNLATTVRAVIMALFLLGIAAVTGKFEQLSTIDSKAFMFILFSGIAGALSWLFYFIALKNGPVTGVAAVDRTSVVFVLIFSILILGGKLTAKSLLGAIFITIGAILMSI